MCCKELNLRFLHDLAIESEELIAGTAVIARKVKTWTRFDAQEGVKPYASSNIEKKA